MSLILQARLHEDLNKLIHLPLSIITLIVIIFFPINRYTYYIYFDICYDQIFFTNMIEIKIF